MNNQAIDFQQIQRVLVIKLRHHGDVLLSSPVFQVLKNHYPHIQTDALVYKDTAPMLEHHPSIDHVYYIDRNWKKQGKFYHLRQELALLKQLKKRQYDLVIHLTEHWRGLTLIKLLRPRYSVSAAYHQRRGDFWRRSFTHLYETGMQQHIVEQNLAALAALGIESQAEEQKLVLEPGEQARQSIQSLLAKHQLRPKQFIHIHPGSRWLFKCWKESHFHEFMQHLLDRGEQLVITAAPDDKEMQMVNRILQGLEDKLVNLSGQLSLLELAALTEQAKAYVGVDTAPTHIAAAMQTPLVVLFGPSTEALWGPWKAPSIIVTDNSYTCRSCNQDGCEGSKISDCLYSIEATTVLQALDRVIKG